MKVAMSKSFQVHAPMEQVWDFLSNIEQVTTCVPGAEITGSISDTQYAVTITVKVGPIKSSYKGEVTITELDADQHRLKLVGKGQDTKGKGGATMELVGILMAIDEGTTEVQGDSTVTISGMLAQFGSRMVEDVSNQMFDQFTQCLRSRLEGGADAASGPAQAAPVAGMSIAATALKGAFRRTVDSAKEKIGLSSSSSDEPQ